MPRCIYCLRDKPQEDFNREHVVPRMFGTYGTNAPVLGNYQVCKECNSFFSTNFENVIGHDSIEALHRIMYGKAGKEKVLRGKRMRSTIASGVLKGLSFNVVADETKPERCVADYPKRIGICKNIDPLEYDFYTLEELPQATEERLEIVSNFSKGIITVGYTDDEEKTALIEKGWLAENSRKEMIPMEAIVGDEDKVEVLLRDVDDPVKRRFVAKVVFNYLCYTKGKEVALYPVFDPIRNYIRFGQKNDIYFITRSMPDKAMELQNKTAHCIGYLWNADDRYWSLYGCVTWYGIMTYVFKLCETNILVSKLVKNRLPRTSMLYCDNQHRLLRTDDSYYLYRKQTGLLWTPMPYEVVEGEDSLLNY